jgi:hypothetical protein
MRNDKAALGGADTATTPAQLRTEYTESQTALHEAGSVVPDAIKSDFGTVVATFDTFRGALVAANYDMRKVAPGALQVFETPTAKLAATRVGAYLEQVCKITVPPSA